MGFFFFFFSQIIREEIGQERKYWSKLFDQWQSEIGTVKTETKEKTEEDDKNQKKKKELKFGECESEVTLKVLLLWVVIVALTARAFHSTVELTRGLLANVASGIRL